MILPPSPSGNAQGSQHGVKAVLITIETKKKSNRYVPHDIKNRTFSFKTHRTECRVTVTIVIFSADFLFLFNIYLFVHLFALLSA